MVPLLKKYSSKLLPLIRSKRSWPSDSPLYPLCGRRRVLHMIKSKVRTIFLWLFFPYALLWRDCSMKSVISIVLHRLSFTSNLITIECAIFFHSIAYTSLRIYIYIYIYIWAATQVTPSNGTRLIYFIIYVKRMRQTPIMLFIYN